MEALIALIPLAAFGAAVWVMLWVGKGADSPADGRRGRDADWYDGADG